jgi:hypothetical protein
MAKIREKVQQRK